MIIVSLIHVVNLRRQRFLWWRNFQARKSSARIVLFVNTGSSARQTKGPQEKGFSMTIEFSIEQRDKLENRFHRAFPCLSSCQNLKNLCPYVTCLWTFRGSGCLLPSTRSGNGLLSERFEDRRLISHLNEVLSEGQREKWSFSMRTISQSSKEQLLLISRDKLKKIDEK